MTTSLYTPLPHVGTDTERHLSELTATIHANAPRVAKLGHWGCHINAEAALTERIPTPDTPASGFDAGIACALDLIPRAKQALAAHLHANYTPRAITVARTDIATLDEPSSDPRDLATLETTWWLAACNVCDDADVNVTRFIIQIAQFRALAASPYALVAAARDCLAHMRNAFTIRDGIAHALTDGGLQGAYLAGHTLAGTFEPRSGLYFLATYLPSLGLEQFPWQEPGDPDAPVRATRLGRSGPVHGSHQYVKCTDRDEYLNALACARAHLDATS